MFKITNDGIYDQLIYPGNVPILLKSKEVYISKYKIEETSALKVEKIETKNKYEKTKEVKQNDNVNK